MNGTQDQLREKLLESVSAIEDAKEPIAEVKEEIKDEVVEIEEKAEDSKEESDVETSDNTEEEPEEKEEDEKENSDHKGIDLKKTLSGQPREFREAVESIKDPEAQVKVIEAGKLLRAREDQVRLELGNLKKEMANFKAFDESLKKDPIQTFKNLAKFAKIDLNSLIEPVQDEYDYRTSEEIAKDNYYKNIESRLAQVERQKQEELTDSINAEIDNFANSIDNDGNLRYPHFDKLENEIFDILAIYNKKQGFPANAKERKERLTLAYKKAELMDDDLVVQRDIENARKATEKRKEELEKAKRLKKFSGRTSSVSVSAANPRAALEDIVSRHLSGAL